ncbi:PREDICTED: uncharacterized protein LOC108565266 [Nicrophorus vespilloides]|uniref:Uncharacterized protein LOC108565266 n=1 Tax=Nicrophorus vespilloides TaxID=110193 RepID=A0ABM1MZW6_NICVS|nr:PREDICTED: uncharacterized protein LOC108565266 [Nicrophorus vespilloides]
MYDVMCANMKFAGRVTFVHRIIYIGEHSFPQFDDEDENISDLFRENIQTVNSQYCEEYLTGFLLYYTKYFCHVVEGSEESIHKHLQMLLTNPETAKHLGRMKILVAYHHINQRFLKTWTEINAKPPTLLEKVDNQDISAVMAKVMICLQKLYKLGIILRPTEAGAEEEKEAEEDQQVASQEQPQTDQRYSTCRRSLAVVVSTVSNFDIIGRPADTLPECQLLQYLLDSEYVQDLEDYKNSYGVIPVYMTYLEQAWPVSSDYVPRDIFVKEIDPVSDIPADMRISVIVQTI